MAQLLIAICSTYPGVLYCYIDFVNRNMAGVCWWKAKRTMLEESKYKEKRRKDVGGHSRTQKSEGKVLCVIASNSHRGWEKVVNSDRTESENERKEKNTEGRVMKSILGMVPKLKRRKDLTDRKNGMCSRHLNSGFVPWNWRWIQGGSSGQSCTGGAGGLGCWTEPFCTAQRKQECPGKTAKTSAWVGACWLSPGCPHALCCGMDSCGLDVFCQSNVFFFSFCTGFVESWLKSNNLLVSHDSRKWE